MSTFETLVGDLTRDVHRAQPKDALQYCANWFQSRLEEQRARTRDIVGQRSPSISRDLPADFYIDIPLGADGPGPTSIPPLSHVSQQRSSLRNSVTPSPFGTLNVPGNALLPDENRRGSMAPMYNVDGLQLPTSPRTNSYSGLDAATPTNANPGDYLHPPTSTIFARRTSVSAESIPMDGSSDEHMPIYPKTDDQITRIKASIANNFIFRDLDEAQETGVLNAMQEKKVDKDEVVIRQGDVGEYFYVVEDGLLQCFIRPEPLPPTWLTENQSSTNAPVPEKFLQPGYHPEFGRKVADCKPGNSFGELALMYGHPRAATVLAIEPSTLWSLDRITFRTIVLKVSHKRRTMYEHFLSTVTLLSSLEPEERSKVADALVSKVYLDGEAVVKQGEKGDTFFFVEDGEAVVTKTQTGDDGEDREFQVGHLKKGDYFGELSLLRLAPRAATVTAIRRADLSQPKLKVAALESSAFTRLLGPLRDIMERKAGESYGSGPNRLSR